MPETPANERNFHMKKVLGCLRRACEEFDMIKSGDKIAVGVSGGKDSILLLYALTLYRRYMKIDYELFGVTVDLGFEGFDTAPIRDFLQSIGVAYHVEKTDIAQVVFDIRKEPNPCSLCAKMRKGAFYEAAARLGCNKAAFAHNQEDLLETLLMSMIYEGKLGVFSPVTYMSRADITLIRPFIYLPEKEIVGQVRALKLPVVKNPCPVDGITKRKDARNLLEHLLTYNPKVKESMLAAIRNTGSYHLWDKLPSGR